MRRRRCRARRGSAASASTSICPRRTATPKGPVFGLSLTALQLPGATAPRDVRVSADGAEALDDALLDLVLSLVKAQADAAAANSPIAAVGGLLGLKSGDAVPDFPITLLPGQGVLALADWVRGILGDTASRADWLGHSGRAPARHARGRCGAVQPGRQRGAHARTARRHRPERQCAAHAQPRHRARQRRCARRGARRRPAHRPRHRRGVRAAQPRPVGRRRPSAATASSTSATRPWRAPTRCASASHSTARGG